MAYEPPADRRESAPPPPRDDLGMGTPTRPVGQMPDVTGAPVGAGGLVDSYKRVVLSPGVAVFEDEIPRASWNKTLLGVGAVMLATLAASRIVTYGFAALLPDLYHPARKIRQAEEQFG